MDAAEQKAALWDMVAAQEEEVEKLVTQWSESRDRGEPLDWDRLEIQIREWALLVGAAMLGRLIDGIVQRARVERSRCPRCSGPVKDERYRPIRIHTSLGDVRSERAYVYCPGCREWSHPLDAELGLDRRHNSRALQRIVSLAGAVAPFEKACDLLAEIGSIVMGAQKVEHVTEEAGRRAEVWMAARQQRAQAGLETPAGSPPGRLYVEADGTTVPMRIEVPRGGASQREEPEAAAPAAGAAWSGGAVLPRANQRTEGKVEYKEVKLGAVFEATLDEQGHPQAGRKVYTGTFGDAETCVRQVQAEARACGSQGAKEIVVLCDGGTWLWNRLPEAFEGKRVTQILDCRHPQERLTQIGKRMFGDGTKEGREWSERQRNLLYDGKTREVIGTIEGLKPKSEETQEYVRQALAYLSENESRMNYGELRKQGYFIGSGIIESACKHISNERFKRAGMKWSRDHVPKLLALRVCRASGWWDRFWKQGHRGAAA